MTDATPDTRPHMAATPAAWLDRITRLAQDLLGSPGAFISMLDETHQVIRSAVGTDWRHIAGSTWDRQESICQWVVDGGAPLLLPDVRADHRLAELEGVHELGFGAYLGVPLYGDGRRAIGALCVVGSECRDWTDADVRKLKDLAALASSEIVAHEPGSARAAARPAAAAPSPAASMSEGDAQLAPLLIEPLLDPAPATAGEGASELSHALTAREREVLSLMARGLPNRAIAQELGIGIDTVKTHVSHLLRKMGVPSRAAAIGEAYRRRLVAD